MISPDKQKERDYLEVFQEVTRIISMVHDPQQVMDLVVRRLPDLLEVDAATIRLLDVATGTLVMGAACGVSEEYLSRDTIDTKEIMAQVLQGRPAARTGIEMLKDHDSRAHIVREGVQSAMTLPIVYQDQVIGILRLLTRDVRHFAAGEIAFAMSLAEQVGIAISNSHMYQEMDNQVRFFKELLKISKLVHSTLDLDSILTTIVDILPKVMGFRGCTVRLLHPATNRLELVAASGLSQEYLGRGSISREDSIFKVLRGEPVVIYDAARDPRVDYHQAIRREGIASILVVPIRNASKVIGVLRLLTATPHYFTAGEINFADAVAEEGGSAIEKARTYRQITLLFNQIEEHERLLQTLIDALWLQLLVIGADRRVVLANRMFLQTQGLTESEVLGRDYQAVSPWIVPAGEQAPLDEVLADRRPLAVLDRLDTKKGCGWFERHLTPILDDDGEVLFVTEVVRDITDQKLLEREKLERVKLEGVIEMAGTAAHELNTPLFAALGTAQLLRDDLSDGELRQELETIIRNLGSIAALTRKMTAATGFTSKEYVGRTRIVELTTADRDQHKVSRPGREE